MNRTAAIVADNGYTDAELLVAYHFLLASDFDVNVFSINGGPITGVMGWVHKHTTAIPKDEAGFNLCSVDILVLIGGVKAIEKLRQNKHLIDAIAARNVEGKCIASICHGSQLLIEADAVRGKVVFGYYSIRKDLENAGAIWPEVRPGIPEVCVDGNICSSTHYDFTGKWIKAAVNYAIRK